MSDNVVKCTGDCTEICSNPACSCQKQDEDFTAFHMGKEAWAVVYDPEDPDGPISLLVPNSAKESKDVNNVAAMMVVFTWLLHDNGQAKDAESVRAMALFEDIMNISGIFGKEDDDVKGDEVTP